MAGTQAPRDDNNVPAQLGYDPTGHQVVALQATGVTTDATTGIKYGTLSSAAMLSASSVAINDKNTTANTLAVDASGKIGVNNFPATQAVNLTQFNGTAAVSAASDANTASGVPLHAVGLWNGTAEDRWYSDGTGKGKVSLYGTNTTPGDMSIKTDNIGNMNVTIQQSGNGVSNSRPLAVSTGGASTSAIAAGTTSNTVIKNGSGRLAVVLITANGSNSMTFYDNNATASGTIIGILPATTTVGQMYPFYLPATNGITAGGNSGNPGVTVGYF